jgi:hypothetical protein
MNFVGRILSLVLVGLLLQFAAGASARATVAPTQAVIASCAGQSASVEQQSIAQDESTMQVVSTSDAQCDKGNCSGLNCTCSCHGLVAVIGALPIALPDVPAASLYPAPPRAFKQAGVHPPVRPPRA